MKRTAEERRAFVEGRAEIMRALPTAGEERLRELLEPLGFKFQVPICGQTKNGGRWDYVMDAYHTGLKLCVEADGKQHQRVRGRDRRRGNRLYTEYEIWTLRFTNNQILKKSKWVREVVEFWIKSRSVELGRAE